MKFETKQLSDGKLTTQMIDQYKSDGFLYPIKILEIEEACTLRKELELIDEKYSKKALKVLHTSFGLDKQFTFADQVESSAFAYVSTSTSE